MNRSTRFCLLMVVCLNQAGHLAGQPGTTAQAAVLDARPTQPFIEVRDSSQSVNFDIAVENRSGSALRISQVELSAYDSGSRLVLRKSLNANALAPSIAVIGEQVIPPGGHLDVFNPFSDFPAETPLTRLDYSFCFLRESNAQERTANHHRLVNDCDFREKLSISPMKYEDKTALILPLRGRHFVWEGHDFYAHHARVPLSNPKLRQLGITANSNQFADDFTYLDDQGRQYQGDPRKLENWFSYARPIYAPAAGTVLATANDIPDNHFQDALATGIVHPKLRDEQDPKDLGNFVLIDHQDGEFSLLLHMQPGSVNVKAGDLVKPGQQIGRIGFSGDSIFPHLHYTLMAGAEVFKDWGVPSYFRDFVRVLGTSSVRVKLGPVNSGDFVESFAPYLDMKAAP